MNPASSARSATTPRSRSRSLRRVWATAASLLFHLITVLVIFGTASGDLVSGGGVAGGDGDPAISVTLVGSDLRPPTQDAGAAMALQVRHDISTDSPLLVADTVEDPQMAALLQGVRGKAARETSQDPGARAPGPRAEARKGGLAEIDREVRGPDGAATSTGALWGQIAPCWRALPVEAQAPVSFEVVLDSTGTLRRPPRIIRPSDQAVPEVRLQAEARALAALGACMPRHDMRFAGGVYRLDFGPRR